MASTTETKSARGKALPFELRESGIQGRGAFATQRIRKGTRIIEYTGEVITVAESDKRYDDESMDRHHTFLFALDNGYVIDAKYGGNESRFINHSCDPNCEAVDDKGRIFVEAIRTIQSGEELAYDYAYERDGFEDEKWEQFYICYCGTANCRGTILAPKKEKKTPKQSAAAKKTSSSGSKKKTKKKAQRKKAETHAAARHPASKRSTRGGAKRSR